MGKTPEFRRRNEAIVNNLSGLVMGQLTEQALSLKLTIANCQELSDANLERNPRGFLLRCTICLSQFLIDNVTSFLTQ
jgi:hypothetical protein